MHGGDQRERFRERRRDDSADTPGRSRRPRGTGRPGQAVRAERPHEPHLPDSITGQELDRDTADELRTLSRETSTRVARHLVASLLLSDEAPDQALEHAAYAARIGGRVGAVREIHGLAAYRTGDYRTAARELRTAQRITGRLDTLPVLADAERGLGRPERALDIAASPDADQLDPELTIELMIVVAGAYADTGDVETALRTLETPALRQRINGRWQVRLWVAYADLLAAAGRDEEAARWIALAADVDTDQVTDAAERLGRPARDTSSVWDQLEEIEVVDVYSDEDPGEHEDEKPRADGDVPVDEKTRADADVSVAEMARSDEDVSVVDAPAVADGAVSETEHPETGGAVAADEQARTNADGAANEETTA